MEDNVRLPSWFWIVAGLLALITAGLGLLLLLITAVFPAAFASVIVVTVGNGLLALGLGLALVIGAFRRWQHLPSSDFTGSHGWWIYLVLGVLALVAGLLLPTGLHQSLVFAPIHLALILAPAFFLLSIVKLISGSRVTISYPHLMLALSGGIWSIILAAPIEIIGLLGSSAVTTAAAMFLPGGESEINRLLMLFERWSMNPPTDPEEVLSIVTSPIVLVTLALTLAVITPLIEELGKALIVGIAGFWLKPGARTAFVWGAAAGFGFALIEGVSSGAMALGENVGWLGGAGTRVLTTIMHGFTSGLVGMGWGYFWRRPSPKRWLLPVFYALAVLIHGLWNFNVILTLGSLGFVSSTPFLGGGVMVLGAGIQIALALGSLAGLLGVPYFLKRRAAA